MNVPKSIPPNLTVPQNSIYNVHILNDDFKVSKTIVFSRTNPNEIMDSLHENTIISTQQIHLDDNIHSIKKKILAELWNIGDEWSFDEMYLFANVRGKPTLQKIYDYANNRGGDGVTYEQLSEIADMLGIELHEKEFASKINYSSLTDEKLFTFSEFFQIIQAAYPDENLHEKNVIIPSILGQRFLKYVDYKLAILPNKITSSHVQKIKNKWQREKNEMIAFNNELLLNHDEIAENNIYLCRASSILKKMDEEEDETLCIQIYFPQLFHQDIKTLADLKKMNKELKDKTKEIINPHSFQLYENVQLMYDTYYGRTADNNYNVKYAYRGINSFHLKIETDFKNKLPLELVFKNLHATRTIPFIQYNPGHKRENIYRIYYEKYTRDGRKIPLLEEKKILKLARRTGKSKNISMYILHTHNDNRPTNLHLYFEKDGYLSIINDFKQTYSSDELTAILRNALNPVFQMLNTFLQSIGLFIRPFYSLEDSWIDIINMTYILRFPINHNLNLAKNLPCIYSIMDTAEMPKNYEKKSGFANDTFWKYKRVENYHEMNQIFSFIHSENKKTNSILEIIFGLMEQFGLSEQDARKHIAKFTVENNIMGGKAMINNPGFPVVFREAQIDNLLEIEISEISSIKYLPIIQIYIDTIIRLTQYADTMSAVTHSHLKDVCSKYKELKNADTEIIAPPMPKPKGIPSKITPNKIDESDSEELEFFIDEDEDGDIMFMLDDDEDYQDKSVNENIDYIHSSDEEDSDDDSEDIMFLGGDSDYDDSSLYGSGIMTDTEDPDSNIMFYDEPVKQSGKGINKEKEEEEFDEEKFQRNPDGAKIPFLRRMQTRDPELFLTSKDGKYKAYATKCQAKSQPVILTDKEKKEIDEKNPGSYHHAVRYGSDEKHAHWYICPRFWCFKTNRSISEEDVKAGKCGKIIPYGSQTIPKGHYVYEFKRDGENDPYVEHNPGFMTGKHPKNLCLPCCYKNYDTDAQRQKREQCKMQSDGEEPAKNSKKDKQDKAGVGGAAAKYIISLDTYPLPMERWGFLPVPVQLFLNFNYDSALEKKTSSVILPNKPVFLRYGVEQSANQSFLGVMADLYDNVADNSNKISVQDFKQVIINKLSLAKFMQLHNAELITVFQPKDEKIRILTVSTLENKYKMKLTEREKKNSKKIELYSKAAAAFENFKDFILSETNIIDHTYMWELFTDNIIYPIGCNLILLEIISNDMTENIQLICPTTGFSNKNIFDTGKPSVIVLKHDEYYEPIYLYENIEKEVREKKYFFMSDLNKNIQNMLKNINKTTDKYCARFPSLPRVYKFETPASLVDILKVAKQNNYVPIKQIMNYNGKIIGVCFSVKNHASFKNPPQIYIPCYPSSPIDKDSRFILQKLDIETVMSDDIDDYASDYETTRDHLLSLENNVLKPSTTAETIKGITPKFKVLEDGIVVGFLTGTNQFVPIHPVSENIHLDNIPEQTLNYGDKYYNIDKDLTNSKEDKERVFMTKKIQLETKFYNIFRNRVRKLLNDSAFISVNKQIISIINHNSYTYYQKLEMIEKILRNLSEGHIIFTDIDDEVLMDLDEINDCSENTESSPYCIYKDNEIPQLVIPKRHLLSGHDNENVYYGRIADDLVRNERVRLFMMNSHKYLNVQNDDYKINNDEFLVVHNSLIDKDYFMNFREFNNAPQITTTGYNTSSPYLYQHDNTAIPLDEQYENLEGNNLRKLTSNECVKGVIPIIGNERQSMWKKLFPDTAKEVVFHNTEECSFGIVSYILEQEYSAEYNMQKNPTIIIKQIIWKGYSKYLKTQELMDENLPKIVKILKQQGKYKMMQNIERGITTLDATIISDAYFLTDLDIWVIADMLDLPIIVFNPNTIKGFNGLEWVLMGGKKHRQTGEKIEHPFYFIRTRITSELNNIANYNLITPSFKLDELPFMYGMIMQGIKTKHGKYSENVQSFAEFLENYI